MAYQHYDPPHEVQDYDKLAAMIEQIRTGNDLPPVVVYMWAAFTGSHRIAAYDEAYRLATYGAEGWEDVNCNDIELPLVELSEEIYLTACKLHDIEPGEEIGEWNLWARRLYDAAKQHGDEDVMAALADQMCDYEPVE